MSFPLRKVRKPTAEERESHVPRAGDVVHHKPSGEDWIVAYADMARDELSWCGWPGGTAKLSDCVLTDIASEESHEAVAFEVSRCGDFRAGAVRERYPEAIAKVEAQLATVMAKEKKS